MEPWHAGLGTTLAVLVCSDDAYQFLHDTTNNGKDAVSVTRVEVVWQRVASFGLRPASVDD